jgi:predicted DNA-binding transcriptional regulator AlpA
MTLPEVRKALGGLSKSSLLRLIADGTFPAPLRVTAQGRVWLEADVLWYLHGLEIESRLNKFLNQPVPAGTSGTQVNETPELGIASRKIRG